MLDKTLRLATKLARYINNLIGSKEKASLLDLRSELYSVIGVLLHLKESVQSEALVDQWATTLTTLCGPTGSLQQFLSMLGMLISTLSSSRGPWESTLDNIDVMYIQRRCQKQKILLLSALENNPQYVRTPDSTQSLITCRVLSQAMEGMFIPRLDEQGVEVGFGQPVEGESDSQKFGSHSG